MYNNFIMLSLNPKIVIPVVAALSLGVIYHPKIFWPLYLALGAYLISLALWSVIQQRKSKGYGLKATFIYPCESWVYRFLAGRKGIGMPAGKVVELHLNPKKKYACSECEEAKSKFRQDLEDDLKLVKQLADAGAFSLTPVVVLNTFNRFWLDRAEKILGAERHPGIVLIKAQCRLYGPEKHKNVFKRMFPNCTLANPGRDSPEKWDLLICTKELKGEAHA